jgi:hypothetical protein
VVGVFEACDGWLDQSWKAGKLGSGLSPRTVNNPSCPKTGSSTDQAADQAASRW